MRIPAMQCRISFVGKSGCFDPAYDRYTANLFHQRVKRGSEGAGGRLPGNRVLGALAAFGVHWHQIDAFLDRPATATKVEQVAITPDTHMLG